MGRRPDPHLERGRLVRVARPHRREARAAGRRRPDEVTVTDIDLGQPVQASGRRGAHAAGAEGDPRGARQLPHRPLHRRQRRAAARPRAASSCRRPRSPHAIDDDTARRDAHARELPQRPHARHGGGDASGPCEGRADRLGPRAFGRRGRICSSTQTHADFAVGCGYKYLNGGPGAPLRMSIVAERASRRHSPAAHRLVRRTRRRSSSAPTTARADGIRAMLCSTPPMLSMAALEAALDAFDGVAMADGRNARAARSAICSSRSPTNACAGSACGLATPRDARGAATRSSFTHRGRLCGHAGADRSAA